RTCGDRRSKVAAAAVDDEESNERYTIRPTAATPTAPKISVPPPSASTHDGSGISGFLNARSGSWHRKHHPPSALMRVPHDAQMTNPISSDSVNPFSPMV